MTGGCVTGSDDRRLRYGPGCELSRLGVGIFIFGERIGGCCVEERPRAVIALEQRGLSCTRSMRQEAQSVQLKAAAVAEDDFRFPKHPRKRGWEGVRHRKRLGVDWR